MLKISENHRISEAYKRILEAQSLPQREYAFHCTNVNPEIIKSEGFINKDGFTMENQFPGLYEEYLPDSRCFVGKRPWDSESKYIIRMDITGMQKYPDFGHLLDYDAYYEECGDDVAFWWEDKLIPREGEWTSYPAPLSKYLREHGGVIYASDFDGDLSWELVGTCCIDGAKITPERIVKTL